MNIQTFWQPAYTPPGFTKVEYVEPIRTKDRILAHLTEHGPTARHIIVEKLCITNSVFRHAIAEFTDEVEFEQSGSGINRISMYWLKGNPPPPEKRASSTRLYEWFKENPWRTTLDIPDDIYTAKHKHGSVHFLVKQGRLIGRKEGNTKQYRVAA